ncbi:MAG: protein kinase [Nannocystis sp.]|nr:protein kinase [Nannocystis sp.]
MGEVSSGDLDASFGASRPRATKIEAQQLKESVRSRLFGTSVDSPQLGDFTILRRIGRGGMGAVYEASSPRGGRVALKTLRGFSPAALYHLKHEFRALVGLSHENLVSLHKLVVQGDQAFFTMELVHGVDFVRYVRGEEPPRAPLSAEGLLRLRAALPQLVAGVAALHRAGKLHRDIKPSNILVTGTGRVVLLDFGLVRDISEVSALTSSNESFVGTPAYIAPEAASGARLTEAGDWYGLGVVLFEALVGELPFSGTGFQVLVEKCNEAPPRPSSRASGVPADLDALCWALLAREPGQRPAVDALVAQLGGEPAAARREARGPSAGGLVGRDEHLSRLRGAFDAACSRPGPRFVCLSGPPGHGKSALLQVFLEECQQGQDALVLSGRCYTAETVPFRAFDPLIDALTGALLELPPEIVLALLPAEGAALVQLFPVLGRVPGLAACGAPALAEEDRASTLRRACEALRCLLGRLASIRPLVLAIDDLQWGDDDSLALMGELFKPGVSAPILAVFAVRSGDQAGEWILRALSEGCGLPLMYIEVGRLEPEAAVLVAQQRLAASATTAAGPGSAEAIAAESDGSPLLIVEMVRYVCDAGGAPRGRVRLDEVLRERIDALALGLRGLLEVVAVAGLPIELDLAAQIAEPDGRSAALRAAQWAALRSASLVRAGLRGGEDVIEVQHERIRELVLEGIGAGRLRSIHDGLAAALMSRGAAPELLARHLRAAGRLAEALAQTILAGEQAIAALAFRRAISFFNAGLEMSPGAEQARELHRRIGEALVLLGRGVEAAEHFGRASIGAAPAQVLALQRASALVLLRCGEFERGRAAMRAVIDAAGETWPKGQLHTAAALAAARLRLRLRGVSPAKRPDLSQSARIRLEALEAAREGLSSVEPALAALFQARYLLQSLAVGDPDHLAPALAGEAAFLAYFSDSMRPIERLAEARALLRSARSPRARESIELCTGVVEFCRGEWAPCLEALARMRALGLVHDGSGYIAALAGFFELSALFFRGQWRRMSARQREMRRALGESGDRVAMTSLQVGFSVFTLLAEDRWQEAETGQEAALAGWPAGGFSAQRTWAFHAARATDLYAGDPERAWARCEAAWPSYRRIARHSGPFIRAQGALWRGNVALMGALPGASGDPQGRLKVASQMRQALAAEVSPWVRPFERLLAGGIARARGQMEQAAADYAAAMTLFEGRGMEIWCAAARWRLGEVLGGAKGRALLAAGAQRVADEEVAWPAQIVAALAPGCK